MSRARRTTTRAARVLVMLALGAVLAGCGDGGSGAKGDPVGDAVARQQEQQRAEKVAVAARNAALPVRPRGRVDIAGSTPSSMTPAVVTSYRQTLPGTRIEVQDDAVGDAFGSLCAGSLDVVDSARPISSEEWQACHDVGLDVVQLQVASDALVLASQSQTDIGGDCLSTQAVQDLFRAGSPVTSWKQLGMNDLALQVGGPDREDPAFALFTQSVLGAAVPSLTELRSDYAVLTSDQAAREFVVGPVETKQLAATLPDRRLAQGQARSALRSAVQVLVDATAEVDTAQAEREKGIRDGRTADTQAADAARVTAALAAREAALAGRAQAKVAVRAARAATKEAHRADREAIADSGHLSFFRYGYWNLFADQLRAFEITLPDGERNCIYPSSETITSGEYPLSQPLLLTTTTRSLARGEVRGFLKHYLSQAQALAAEALVVPIPAELLDTELSWVKGTADPVLVAPVAVSTTPATPTAADQTAEPAR